MIKKVLLLFLISLLGLESYCEKFTISGYVKDKTSGEDMIGASIFVKKISSGTATNVYGFYSLTLEKGEYEIHISYLGYNDLVEKINLDKNVSKNIELEPQSRQIEEIIVSAERKDKNIQSLEMSVQKIEMKKLSKMPSFMGETDVLKSMTLMPGVQDGGEGSSGLYVRGGGTDQNLILLDEAAVFNASHLLGFFSVFNSDAIKDMKVYKGGIPAEFGGRLSSLVDIRQKDGNNQKVAGAISVGNISSKGTFEIPIVKDKSSLLISGRRTYADLFFVLSEDTKDTKLYFYDLNLKFNYKFSNKDRLFISGYMGKDAFGYKDMMEMSWGNKTLTARWNHLFSDKLFMNTTLIYNDYTYNLEMGMNESMSWNWISDIKGYTLKSDLNWFINKNNNIKFGFSTMLHNFQPGSIDASDESFFDDFTAYRKNAIESAVYLSNEQTINDKLSLMYGLRVSMFNQIGQGKEYNYRSETYSLDNLIEDPSASPKAQDKYLKTEYSKAEIIKKYTGWEPRFSAKYAFTKENSVKLSYNRTYQYLHLMTNTNNPTPLDIWTPSSKYIKPQIADQVALGYFQNFMNNMFEASVEGYYKNMQNQIDFKDNAQLLLNNHIETEIKVGKAYSYGLEVLLQKKEGDLSGWISYTWSNTKRKIDGIFDGKEYSPAYDRPHDLKIVLNYNINKKWSVSANWKYTTGFAYTPAIGKYPIDKYNAIIYGDRNSFRSDDFHRLDISFTYDPTEVNIARKKWYSGIWNISLINVYARRNAYSIYFKEDEDDNKMKAYRMSIIPTLIPSVSYTLKF